MRPTDYIRSLGQKCDLDMSSFEKLPFHFYLKDKKGKYLACNNAQAATAGLDNVGDITHYTDFDLPWSVYAPILRKNDNEIIATKNPKMILEPGVHLGGVEFQTFSFKMPLYDSMQKVIGLMGFSFILDVRNAQYLVQNSLKQKQIVSDITLTPKENECLSYLLKGYSAKLTANMLDISSRTVEHHLKSIKDKYSCKTKLELISIVMNQASSKPL